MDTSSKIFIQILNHNKSLLDEEIKTSYPTWKKVQELKDLIIFETSRVYSIEEIGDLPISFALGKGKYLGAFSENELSTSLSEIKQVFATENIHQWDLSGNDIKMGDRKRKGPVIDLFKYGQETHVGVRFQVRGDFAPYNGTSPIPINEKISSCEYQCLAESFKHFRPLVAHDEVFLDIEGHEGGRTYFLLEKGFRVIGLDKLSVNKIVTSTFKEDYLHIEKDFSEIKAGSFTALPPIEWIVAKVDVSDVYKINKIIKLLEGHDDSRGMMLTLKVTKDQTDINQTIDLIRNSSFSVIRTGQLPSHKKEFSVLATR